MEESVNTARRGFLSRFAKPAQQLVEPEIEATPRSAPRPPRALDEALFVRQCNGCGDCKSACPTSVIEMVDELPQLNLDYSDCTLCDECSKACKTGALHQTQALVTELRPTFSNNCNNYLMEDCKQCEIACLKQAISIEEGELPVINKERCDGCGVCRNACYMGCVSLVLPS